MHALLILVLALACSSASTACGDGTTSDGPGSPVAISAANLRGYWVSVAEAGTALPRMLHFGAAAYGDEPVDADLVELVNFDAVDRLERFALEGSTLAFPNMPNVHYPIARLTTHELVVSTVDGVETTFRRRDACEGASTWSTKGFAEVHDAAWDRFGALHMIVNDNTLGLGGHYVYLAPGRCTPTILPLSVTGRAIDVGADGSVRLAGFTPPANGTTTAIATLIELAPKPWENPTLDPTVTEFVDANYLSASPPPMRIANLPDGTPMVIYAVGLDLRTFTKGSDEHHVLPTSSNSSFTPERLMLTYAPDGSFVVQGSSFRQGDRARRGQRWADGSFSDWQAEPIREGAAATLFAWGDDGALVATWSEEQGPLDSAILYVARRPAPTADWQIVSTTTGYPVDIAARPDGSVDVVAQVARQQAPLMWVRVPSSFEPMSWSADMHLDFNGTPDAIFGSGLAEFGYGRFGPNGEILLAAFHGVWHRPGAGNDRYLWQELAVKFESESPIAVVFPTLGERCESDCSFLAPPASFVPMIVEPGADAVSVVVINALPTGDGTYSVRVDGALNTGVRKPGGNQVIVRGGARRMDQVVDLGEGSPALDIALAADGRAVALHSLDGVAAVSRFAAGEVVASASIAGRLGLPTGPGAAGRSIAALAEGGVVVRLAGGLVFLDAALQPVREVALDGGAFAVALGSSGAFEVRYGAGGATFDLIHHSPSASLPPVTTALAPSDAAMSFAAFDGGVVAFRSTIPNSSERDVAWTKLGADGASEWTLDATLGPAVLWDVEGDALLAWVPLFADATVGGETFSALPEGPSQLALEIDGAGALVASRVALFGLPTGAPLDLALGPAGIAWIASSTPQLTLEYLPFDDAAAVVRSEYTSDVLPGHCLQPGVQCAGNVARLTGHGGALSGLWDQPLATRYDGAAVAGRRVVHGVWTPNP